MCSTIPITPQREQLYNRYFSIEHTRTRPRGLGWRIHGSVEDTKLSTNKQHHLSLTRPRLLLQRPPGEGGVGFP